MLNAAPSRQWSLYLLLVIAMPFVLDGIGVPSVTVRTPSDESVEPSAASIAAAPRTLRAVSSARDATVSELAQDNSWLAGAKAFNNAYLQRENANWRAPPAGAAVPAEVVALHAASRARPMPILSIEGPRERIEEGHLLEVSIPAGIRQIDLPAKVEVAPLPGDSKVTLVVKRRRWFLSPLEVTDPVLLDMSELPRDAASTIELPVNVVGHDKIAAERLTLTLERPSPGRRAVGYEERTEVTDNAAFIGSTSIVEAVSAQRLRPSATHLMLPAARYTTLIADSDQDLRPVVLATRTDNGMPVGAYSPELGMLAVVVDARASIRLEVDAPDDQKRIDYRIIGLSADRDPSKVLLLWKITHDFGERDGTSPLLSRADVDARIRWLLEVLDVRFEAAEIDAVTEPELRSLLQHVASLQSGAK